MMGFSMNNAHKLIAGVLGSLAMGFGSAYAEAPAPDVTNQPESRIFFDFPNKSLLVYGAYSAAQGSTIKGGDAELNARNEGKQALSAWLRTVCTTGSVDDSLKARFAPREVNAQSLRSQGSELFPGGSLLIKLTIPMNKVFPKYPGVAAKPLANGAKETFVLKIPQVPASLVQCGAVPIKIAGNKTVLIIPVSAGHKAAPQTTAINFSLEPTALVPQSQADMEALQRAGVATPADGKPFAVPVLPTTTSG